jgi:hypothetical protein
MATDEPGKAKKCRNGSSERRQQISAVDISRAYFNAPTDPADPSYVELPAEDPDYGRYVCSLLLKHMYGTRRAADGWQQEYASAMISLGFTQGIASPCLFYHKGRDIVTSVHGDDFTSAAEKRHLDWFESALEDKYELKRGGRFGPGPEDSKEITVLNRVLRYTDQGLEYEADQRHADLLIKEMKIEDQKDWMIKAIVKNNFHFICIFLILFSYF